MLSLDTVRAVITLAYVRSFKRAAEALGVSPAKLTRIVQRAELDCGFQIFERHRLGTDLTDRGQRLVEACRNLDQVAQNFEESLEEIRADSSEVLKISSGPLATHTVVIPLLKELLHSHPSVSVVVKVVASGEPVQQLRDGEIDLFIGDLSHTSSYHDLRVRSLQKREIIFAARPGHRIHSGGPYKLAELLQKPLAVPHLHKYWQFMFDSVGEESADGPYVQRVESDDYHTLITLATETDLMTAGTEEQLGEAISSNRLVRVMLTDKLRYNLCCARRDNHSSEALEYAWQELMR